MFSRGAKVQQSWCRVRCCSTGTEVLKRFSGGAEVQQRWCRVGAGADSCAVAEVQCRYGGAEIKQR